MNKAHKDLVHDAWLEIHSDPEIYSRWQHEFIDDLEKRFKDGTIKSLSEKQKQQVVIILTDIEG